MSTPDFDNKLYTPKYDYNIETDIVSGYIYRSNDVLESNINNESASGIELKLLSASAPEYSATVLQDSTTSSYTTEALSASVGSDDPIFPTVTWTNDYAHHINPDLRTGDTYITTWKAMGPTAYVTKELLFGRCYDKNNKLTTMYPFRLTGCDSSYLKIYNGENGSTKYEESTCSNVFLLETVSDYRSYTIDRASFSIYPSDCYTHSDSDFEYCSCTSTNYGLTNNCYYSVCIQSCWGSITLHAPGRYSSYSSGEDDWQGAIYIHGRNTYVGACDSDIITLGCQYANFEYCYGCFCITCSSISKCANIQAEEVSLGTHNIYYHFHNPCTKDEDGNYIYYHGYALSTSSKTNIYGETIRLESHPSISYHQCTTTDSKRCDKDMLCDAFIPQSYIEINGEDISIYGDTSIYGEWVDITTSSYFSICTQDGLSRIVVNGFSSSLELESQCIRIYANDTIGLYGSCINLGPEFSEFLVSNWNDVTLGNITNGSVYIQGCCVRISIPTEAGCTDSVTLLAGESNYDFVSSCTINMLYINTDLYDSLTRQGTYEVTRGIYSSSIDSHTSVVKNLHDRIFRLSCDSTSFCAKPTVALKDDVLYEYEVWQTISGTDVTYEAPADVVWLCGNPVDKVTTLYTGTTLYYSFRAFNKKDSEGATVVEIHGNMYAQVDPT